MNFDLQSLSPFSGWEQLAQTGMSFGTNLLAALRHLLYRPLGHHARGDTDENRTDARQSR